MPERTRGRHYQRRTRGPRSSWLPAAVVIIVVAAAVVGVALWASSDGHPSANGRPSATGGPSTTGITGTTVAATTTTTTTTPPPVTVSVVPPLVGNDSITYTFPTGTPVVVTAVGSCWIEARPSASGRVIQQGILRPGQQVTFPSPVWIRFGDPTSAEASAGGAPLRLPSLAGQLIVVSP